MYYKHSKDVLDNNITFITLSLLPRRTSMSAVRTKVLHLKSKVYRSKLLKQFDYPFWHTKNRPNPFIPCNSTYSLGFDSLNYSIWKVMY